MVGVQVAVWVFFGLDGGTGGQVGAKNRLAALDAQPKLVRAAVEFAFLVQTELYDWRVIGVKLLEEQK